MAKKIVKKGMKKGFFEVKAPLTSTKIQLYAYNPEELVGKTVKLDLTKSLRGKNLVLVMRIKNNEGVLEAVPEKAELAMSYMKKAVRTGIDYAEDSFEVECRDAVLRVKPFLITRRRVSRGILNLLRDSAKKTTEAYIKTRDSMEVFSDVIANKLQKQLAQKLKKIYPLAMCEIRVVEVVKK